MNSKKRTDNEDDERCALYFNMPSLRPRQSSITHQNADETSAVVVLLVGTAVLLLLLLPVAAVLVRPIGPSAAVDDAFGVVASSLLWAPLVVVMLFKE
jgi:hypothetical protein